MKRADGGVLEAVWTWEVGAVVLGAEGWEGESAITVALIAEGWMCKFDWAVGAVVKGTEVFFSPTRVFSLLKSFSNSSILV